MKTALEIAMNERRRMAYLSAMGVDAYISRVPLPGAAPLRRLAIVAPAAASPKVVSATANTLPERSAAVSAAAQLKHSKAQLRARTAAREDVAPPAVKSQEKVCATAPGAPHFSLATIVAGDWLWLESLGDRALAREQTRLVSAMARALQVVEARSNPQKFTALQAADPASDTAPDIAQFDWPMHDNQQLDHSADAARAGVSSFLERRLQQHQCRGLVLLGDVAAGWVLGGQLSVPMVATVASADILDRPALKRQVWEALQGLLGP